MIVKISFPIVRGRQPPRKFVNVPFFEFKSNYCGIEFVVCYTDPLPLFQGFVSVLFKTNSFTSAPAVLVLYLYLQYSSHSEGLLFILI